MEMWVVYCCVVNIDESTSTVVSVSDGRAGCPTGCVKSSDSVPDVVVAFKLPSSRHKKRYAYVTTTSRLHMMIDAATW